MGRACTVCMHARRNEIEERLVKGISKRQIAQAVREYGEVSVDALDRHDRNHIPKARRDKLLVGKLPDLDIETLKETESQLVLVDLVERKARVIRMLDEAERLADFRAYSSLIGRLNEISVLVAKLLGQIGGGNTTINTTINTVVAASDYYQYRTAMMRALMPHAALADLEDGPIHVTGTPKRLLDVQAMGTGTQP
jgi:hypothetical protein